MKYVYIRGEEGLLDYFLSLGATNPYYYKCNSNTDVYYIDENYEIHAFDIKIIDVCKKPITTLKEVKNMNKQSLKSKLKPGMVVKTREEEYYLFINNRLIRNSSWLNLDNYHENLTFLDHTCSRFDIVEVFNTSGYSFNTVFRKELLNSVWKRQTTELTLQEIADKFGIPVEQLRIKD